MVTITRVVEDILNKHVFLNEAVRNGIVSYNKLAENIKPEIEYELGKKVKHNAVVMALRRNADRIEGRYTYPSIGYSIETIKTDLCYVVFEASPTLQNKIQKIYPIINFKKGGILNIIQSNFEVSIMINKKYKEDILSALDEEKLVDVIDNLVSISLAYDEDFLKTPGIIYEISRFMAWENINIIDMILTKMELQLVIENKDLMRCYKTLGRFNENKDKKDIKTVKTK